MRPRRISAGVAVALLLAAGGGVARAQNAVPATPGLLSGKTLSAMIYVRRPPSQPGPSELARFMFQAYLEADGRAWVRVWDTAADAYTRPSLREWSVTPTPAGSRLCLGLPQPAPDRICADLHVWGPRIAGLGVNPYVMLDGDVEPGNALIARR
ncbi:MAG TPA: hypothetical protein VJ770_14445 [Stellaceae bacterium]|nr:hypothetical protein [Stellaceae bacterium]